MGRKSSRDLPPGIHIDKAGSYWATLEGEDAKRWRERHPERTLPRRKAASLGAAVKLQRQLINDLDSGRDPNAENPPLATLVEEWINQREKLRPATRRRYEQSFRWQIKPLRIGRLRLRQLTHSHVQGWVRELKHQARQDDPARMLDPYSIRNAFAVLRAALNSAVKDGLIPFNPCRNVELPPPDDDEITPLTPQQVEILLAMLDTFEIVRATGERRPHRLAALYHLAIRLGLRQGELIGLRWRDLDLDRGQLRVTGQLQGGKRTKGKSRHAHRSIPLSSDMVRLLRAHRQNQLEEQQIGGEGWNSAGMVFCSDEGTPLNPSNLWRQFAALQRRAGLTEPCKECAGSGKVDEQPCADCNGHGVSPLFRFHDLRHTYAALSLAAGVDLFTVSRRMGHSSITVTSDRYGHLYQGDTHDAEAVDRLLKKA
ncbi:MAG: site-specific integrase [Chloroflexales bacterium]|nr:site-specific integrase [Chloroflexales bacterium]